jgi:hypothetical protein
MGIGKLYMNITLHLENHSELRFNIMNSSSQPYKKGLHT